MLLCRVHKAGTALLRQPAFRQPTGPLTEMCVARGPNRQKIQWRAWRAGISKQSMITDIVLGLVYCSIFFALGIVAFTYLAKGKN